MGWSDVYGGEAEFEWRGLGAVARIDHGELGEGRVGQWSGVAAAAARPVEAVRGDVVLARKLGYGETGRLEGGDDAVRFVMRPRSAGVGHPNRFAGFNRGLGWVGRTCTESRLIPRRLSVLDGSGRVVLEKLFNDYQKFESNHIRPMQVVVRRFASGSSLPCEVVTTQISEARRVDIAKIKSWRKASILNKWHVFR